jgi:chaperonin GroEL (HSP60 family)
VLTIPSAAAAAAAAAGEIVDMKELGVWEPLMVKTQTFKTAIEAGGVVLLL